MAPPSWREAPAQQLRPPQAAAGWAAAPSQGFEGEPAAGGFGAWPWQCSSANRMWKREAGEPAGWGGELKVDPGAGTSRPARGHCGDRTAEGTQSRALFQKAGQGRAGLGWALLSGLEGDARPQCCWLAPSGPSAREREAELHLSDYNGPARAKTPKAGV